MKFKKITSEEWKKFRELRLKGLKTDPQAFGGAFETESQLDEASWRNRLSDPDRRFYAAEDDSVFVAVAGSKRIDNGNWMIVAVYTLPEFRGRDLSQQLISSVIEEAKSSDANKVSLMVNVGQEKAVGLYKKMGFEIIRTEKDQKMGDGKLYDEYYMEKMLTPDISS